MAKPQKQFNLMRQQAIGYKDNYLSLTDDCGLCRNLQCTVKNIYQCSRSKMDYRRKLRIATIGRKIESFEYKLRKHAENRALLNRTEEYKIETKYKERISLLKEERTNLEAIKECNNLDKITLINTGKYQFKQE